MIPTSPSSISLNQKMHQIAHSTSTMLPITLKCLLPPCCNHAFLIQRSYVIRSWHQQTALLIFFIFLVPFQIKLTFIHIFLMILFFCMPFSFFLFRRYLSTLLHRRWFFILQPETGCIHIHHKHFNKFQQAFKYYPIGI